MKHKKIYYWLYLNNPINKKIAGWEMSTHLVTARTFKKAQKLFNGKYKDNCDLFERMLENSEGRFCIRQFVRIKNH